MTIGPEAQRPHDFGQKPAQREGGSFSEQIVAITSCVQAVLEKADEKTRGKTVFKGKKNILEELKTSSLNNFSYENNGTAYRIYHFPYNNSQRVEMEANDATMSVYWKDGIMTEFEASLLNSDDHEKTIALNLEESSMLTFEQRIGGLTIAPLLYEIGESGDMELWETQGISARRQGEVEAIDSKWDDEANKLTISCNGENFEFPLKIKFETLFKGFGERLTF